MRVSTRSSDSMLRLAGVALPIAAALLFALPDASASNPEPGMDPAGVVRCLFGQGGAGEPAGDSLETPAPSEKPLSEALSEDEGEEPPEGMDEGLKQEGMQSYQQTRKYAARKLENVRIAVSIFNFMWIEMKEGTAGWGHYDDLFESGAVFTKITLGDFKLPIPIGGLELSYIGMPLYQILMGAFYEIYTGRHFLGNKFDDLIISNVYIGFRINLFNEYTALMKWDEMFEFSRPKHFLGINIYLKGAVFLAIWNRVKYTGNFATGHQDTYFNQTESLGYFLLAGFEYRYATFGLFFEAGWKQTTKPRVARPLVSVNHYRSFPVEIGLTVYFGG